MFALFLLVKKLWGKSSFCIGSTQLRFAVSKVIIEAIVWFVNALQGAVEFELGAVCSVTNRNGTRYSSFETEPN